MSVWVLPLEKLDQRYTTLWYYQFKREFEKSGVKYQFIDVEQKTDKIQDGEFLDVRETIRYKFSQLTELVSKVKDGDWIFLFDIWFPGIEGLAYIKHGLGIDIKFAGILHDGTYDIEDFVYRTRMKYWGEHLENCWFEMFDKIFVGSEFHKNHVCMTRKVNPQKVFVTGLPFYPDGVRRTEGVKKEDIVVFPHRLNEDKRPWKFDKLTELAQKSKIFKNYQFIKTQAQNLSKEKYFQLLAKSKFAVSFSRLEMFGYGMLEAVVNNCIPIVPDDLSYKEMYPPEFRYPVGSSVEDVLKFMKRFETCDPFGDSGWPMNWEWHESWHKEWTREVFKFDKYEKSIKKMINIVVENW